MTTLRGWPSLLAGLVLMLAGCAQVSHVPAGQAVVGQRMVVDLDRGWNQFANLGSGTMPTWTREGITVDKLVFYAGLRSGDLIAPTPAEPKGQPALIYRAEMTAAEIVSLFERLYTRGGSTFTLDNVSQESFVGVPGYRFEFSSIRKSDDVRLRGVGIVRCTDLVKDAAGAVIASRATASVHPRIRCAQVQKPAFLDST